MSSFNVIHNEKNAKFQQHALLFIAIIFLCSGVHPTTAQFYETSMMKHMLVQMPLLVIVGWFVPMQFSPVRLLLARYDQSGAIAVVVLISCTLFWMLPLNLDQAAFDPQFRALKLVSVPLGIGLCLRWICTRSYPIVRIVIFFELWASVARLGWLYIESPEQLCSNYLIGEQRLVGTVLLTLALLTGLIGLFVGIFGSYAKLPNKHIAKPIQSK